MGVLRLKIDVTKIDKSKLFKGKKGTYLDMVAFTNDELDEYGNNISIQQSQTKEEIEANGRLYIGSGVDLALKGKPSSTPVTDSIEGDGSDLPF